MQSFGYLTIYLVDHFKRLTLLWFCLGRVLIVTGNFNDGMPQVVDLLDSSVSCELLPNFTNSTWTIDDAAGGLLNEDIPLVCGGNPFSNNTGPKLDECYIVGKPEAGVVAKMETPKSYTAFAVIRGFDTTKDKLFIAGSPSQNEHFTDITQKTLVLQVV